MSIKQFFSAHAKLFPASMVPAKTEKAEAKEHYHTDVLVPETIEDPAPVPRASKIIKSFFTAQNAIWAAKTKAAVKPAPPAGETKYTIDHEMDALNLWAIWAAKTKPIAPMTEREIENIKNKSWTAERRA